MFCEFLHHIHTSAQSVNVSVRARLCVCACKTCRSGAFSIYRTLISPYCSSARIQLFKNGTREYQETAPQRSRRLFMGTICPSTRARARVRRARVYWKAPRAQGGRSLTNIGPAHWHQPPGTLFHTRLASLRLGPPPTHPPRPGQKPTRAAGSLISDFNA